MAEPTCPAPYAGDENNLIAAGALYMLLHLEATTAGRAVTAVDLPEGPSNRILVRFSFLKSPYWITVERLPDSGEAAA
jgi:hypothetical protein